MAIRWKLTEIEKEELRKHPIIFRPFIYLIGVLLIEEGFI